MALGPRQLLTGALSGLLLLGGVLPCALRTAYADPPPNVVVFMTDDMGWTDWQYDANSNPTGSKVYETPSLLQLAQRSVQVTNAYAASPVCSPTRAAVLTGKSPARTRITNYVPGIANTTTNLKEPFDWVRTLPGKLTIPNLASTLQSNGYSTGFFGKWHLGTASITQFYGFDVNVGGANFGGPGDGSGGWFAGPDGMWAGMPGLDTPGQFPSDKYLSDALSEKAGDYIQQHAGQPFFLANFDYQVHIPLQAPADLVTKYTNKIQTLQGQGVDLKGHTNATYAAMVEKMDQAVGNMMARLDDPNLDGSNADSVLDNTIFIFTSDNGGDYDADGNPTRNLPAREGKGSMYDGGLRVPFLASWGNNTNMAQGTMSSARMSLYDLFPTIFDMTGVAMPANNPIDGVSIRSALEGAAFDRGLLYWHYPHRSNQDLSSSQINGGAFVSAVANKDWKLIFYYEDRHYELYNTTADIGETTNLLAFNPAIASELSLSLNSYLAGVNAQMPLCNTTAAGNAAGCTVLNAPVGLPDVLAAPMPGDYNGDAVVDGADYGAWRSTFGSATHLAADGNRNGVVDVADYTIWRRIFTGVGSGVGGLAAVPEPASVVAFVATLFLALSARRRR